VYIIGSLYNVAPIFL